MSDLQTKGNLTNKPELIELSKQAAEVLGISAYTDHDVTMVMNEAGQTDGYRIWLAEDSGRCAEIAADRRIGTIYYQDDFVIATWIDIDGDYRRTTVFLADHNNNRLRAYCVAVLKAVIEQGRFSEKRTGKRVLRWLL